LVLEDMVLRSNLTNSTTATYRQGGAVAVYDTSRFEAYRTTFLLNRLDTPPGYARGGAIGVHPQSYLVLDQVTFDRNHAQTVGGALYLETLGGRVDIARTLFIDNDTSERGGAVDVNCNTSGTVRFENSTFFGNVGQETIYVCGDEQLELLSCTFADNTGQIYKLDDSQSMPGGVFMRGSIVVDDGDVCAVDGGAVTSGGGNISTTADADCNWTHPSDQIDDPQVAAPPADNGGPVRTLALMPTSPAIGAAAGLACPATDQRGYPRDGACDAGAYEFGAAP
jgi:hypothetical protein